MSVRAHVTALVAALSACSSLQPGSLESPSRPGDPSPDGGPDVVGWPPGTPASPVFPPLPDPDPPFAFQPLQPSVEEYRVELPAGTFESFMNDPWLEEQPATFAHEGRSWPVMVRLRGASARLWPKKSWRVDFGEGVRFDGRRKLNLIAQFQDCSMMAEKLGYDLLAAMNVPSPRAKFVKLFVNGRYEGVYVDLERVDKRFLEANRFADDDASIYRCGTKDCEMKLWHTSYQRDWIKETNEAEPRDDLDALLALVNRAPEPDFPRLLAAEIELDRFLRALAMDAMIANNVIQDSKSYWIHDRKTGRWTYVPWDVNNADSRYWPGYGVGTGPIAEHPLVIFSLTDGWVEKLWLKRRRNHPDILPAFSHLHSRVVFNPVLRAKYVETLERALREVYTEERLHARIDAMHALIRPFMRDDPYIDFAKFDDGRRFLRAFATERRAFIEAELARLRAWSRPLVIDAFDPREGWIVLANRGEVDAETSGLEIATDLRRRTGANVPSTTIPAGRSVRFTAAQLGVRFDVAGEVALFDASKVVEPHDVLFYGELPVGSHWARGPNGGAWEIR